MKSAVDSDQTMIRYLLNELSPEEEERFEEAYLGDSSLFEQARALEDELIEDYVKGNLTDHERRRFEAHYLSTDRRRAKVEIARQLVRLCSLEAAARGAVDASLDQPPVSGRSHLQSLTMQRLIRG